MTDAKYLFVSDSREKKSVARSAVHRKGGSKSKKCTLPSDYIRAQIDREQERIFKDKFIPWEERYDGWA